MRRMTFQCLPVQAVIVGGGYIGLETAAGLSMNGLDVRPPVKQTMRCPGIRCSSLKPSSVGLGTI